MSRNEKKQQTRTAILHAAKELFHTNGYEQTSTEQISKHAGIGTGTLFNYFETKADLFIQALSEQFVEDMDELDAEVLPDDSPVAEVVFIYLYQRIHKYAKLQKPILRDLMGIALSSMQSNPENLHKFIDLDFILVDELIELLNEKGVDQPNEAAEIIYSNTAFEFLFYLYQENRTVEEFMEALKRKVYFILR